MTHVELPALPGPVLKVLAEWAAARGQILIVERDDRGFFYRFVKVGQP